MNKIILIIFILILVILAGCGAENFNVILHTPKKIHMIMNLLRSLLKGDKKIMSLCRSALLLYFAWIVAVIATLGSLYFSKIKMFRPCDLCWYQRIAMYPLSIILGVAASRLLQLLLHHR